MVLQMTQMPDHPYILLITGGLRPGKTNSLFSLINHPSDIDIKGFICWNFILKKILIFNWQTWKKTSLKHFNDFKAFIVYSNDIGYIYKNIEEYNPDKKRKILIAFYYWFN